MGVEGRGCETYVGRPGAAGGEGDGVAGTAAETAACYGGVEVRLLVEGRGWHREGTLYDGVDGEVGGLAVGIGVAVGSGVYMCVRREGGLGIWFLWS